MTLWLFLLVYASTAMVYFVGNVIVQVAFSIGKPPVNGHLQPKIRFGAVGCWFIVSGAMLIPYLIAFFDERGYRSDRINLMLGLYLVIAFCWIIKIQFQVDRLANKDR